MCGESRPLEGSIEFKSSDNIKRELYSEKDLDTGTRKNKSSVETSANKELEKEIMKLRKEINQLKVKEVEKQQTQFGVGIND